MYSCMTQFLPLCPSFVIKRKSNHNLFFLPKKEKGPALFFFFIMISICSHPLPEDMAQEFWDVEPATHTCGEQEALSEQENSGSLCWSNLDLICASHPRSMSGHTSKGPKATG